MTGSPEGRRTYKKSYLEGFKIEAIAELSAFEGPAEQFLPRLLSTQCDAAGAESAVLIRLADTDQLEILAAYPNPKTNGDSFQWIGRARESIREAINGGETLVVPGGPSSKVSGQCRPHLVVLPLQSEGGTRAAAAFRIRSNTHHELLLSQARLENTSFLLNHHALRQTMKMKNECVHRLRQVLELMNVANGSKRFLSTAMALCNEIATRFTCSRVSLGFLDGRCARVRAMSHMDTFSRQMSVVQAIESAMEECLDQDVEVIHPAEDTVMIVNRAAAELSAGHGPVAVLSVPLRDEGRTTAVMTLERAIEQPFQKSEEIETLRLICDLCAPRLLDLYHNDRWFGALMASRARRHLGMLLGHQYTWIKVAAFLLFLLVAIFSTAKGEYRIKTSFALEARKQQVIVAPFDSFIKSVVVEPGEKVEAGKTMLATLETSELRLKLAALKAEMLGYQKEMAASMRDRQTAEAQIAQAKSDKVKARIRLIENQIEKAVLVAPVTGWVVSDDLKQQIGAPVETGKILFEIAGIDSLRAELQVPESAITSVAVGQTGELAVVGHPNQKVSFVIERIHPIAEVVNHRNVFKVRVRILRQLEWMRPGMEGQARISAGKKSYLWIASHRIVNWLRMKLWV